ncbi:Gp138 family membrane-puncturing spike protein [Psychrobacillus sp.]|uniref:Gp138 family membrane-puncturing spike protein n=1 Tax=Psychrobacillus sp. TaxID=1871623 RepID=UPI0028BDB2C0|nr:Gp138 family membrane-puncturing spike protein [Psychrobacillus sp.]
MSNSSEFYANFKNQILLSINTCMPCKVLAYNENTRTAKIQPLFMVKEMNRPPEKLSVLEDVPVLKQKYKVNGGATQEYVPALSVGDTVLAVFCQRAIDDAAEGKLVYPGASRLFDVHDAIIVGLL